MKVVPFLSYDFNKTLTSHPCNSVSEHLFSSLKRIETYLRETRSDKINHIITFHPQKLTKKINAANRCVKDHHVRYRILREFQKTSDLGKTMCNVKLKIKN